MSRDTSFYYSFLVLPDTQRDAIVTVWDACRAIDDAVDEAADEAQAARQIGFWRDEIARVFDADWKANADSFFAPDTRADQITS